MSLQQMNSRLSKIATVKANLVPFSFRQRSELKAPAPDLLTWFEVLGYTVVLESDNILGRHKAEHGFHNEVVLRAHLSNALKQINPKVPIEAIETVISHIRFSECSNVVENNRLFHQYLTQGFDIAYQNNQQTVYEKVRLIDASNLLNNEWLVIDSFYLIEGCSTQCLNSVVFINGIPLAVIIYTYPQNKKGTLKKAYEELEFYKQQIPSLFSYNAFLIVACSNQARVGTLTSECKEFLPWRTIDGEDFPHEGETELEILIQGIFDKRRFLDLIKHFIVFENRGVNLNKQFLRRPFCTIPYSKESISSL
jgi:type I site-specific restriction-modification system R (restriction) subunit